MEEVRKERLTVDHLMANYSKDQLMKLFKYQNINKTPVLAQVDIDMILNLDDDDPQLTRPEKEDTDESRQCDPSQNTE